MDPSLGGGGKLSRCASTFILAALTVHIETEHGHGFCSSGTSASGDVVLPEHNITRDCRDVARYTFLEYPD